MDIMGPEWPYRVTLYRDDWDVVQDWCLNNLGEFDQAWYKLGIDPAEFIMYGDRRTVWYFKREADAMFFRLRWA